MCLSKLQCLFEALDRVFSPPDRSGAQSLDLFGQGPIDGVVGVFQATPNPGVDGIQHLVQRHRVLPEVTVRVEVQSTLLDQSPQGLDGVRSHGSALETWVGLIASYTCASHV